MIMQTLIFTMRTTKGGEEIKNLFVFNFKREIIHAALHFPG